MSAFSFFIVGPTAVGKSALALSLARQLDAEIVSMDAFQIYRGLDIGTGKATAEEQREIPHHLINLADATEAFTVADYLSRAERVQADLRRRKKTSIWVGGTGFYFSALQRGLSTLPPSDPAVLKELERDATEKLAARIRQLDPQWASQADLNNRRRIVRALAVCIQTGQKISDLQNKRSGAVVTSDISFFLKPKIHDLRPRIAARVQTMWKHGWREEVQRFAAIPDWETSQSAAALGYREVLKFLRKQMDRETCLQTIALRTGQFAKRQLTWFRVEPNLVEVPMTAETLAQPEALLPQIETLIHDRT